MRVVLFCYSGHQEFAKLAAVEVAYEDGASTAGKLKSPSGSLCNPLIFSLHCVFFFFLTPRPLFHVASPTHASSAHLHVGKEPL